MILPVLALIAMGGLAAFGSYFLKRASSDGISIKILIQSPYLYIGGVLYIASSALNIYLLKIFPYSIILPLSSLSYIWTQLISKFMLGEEIRKSQLFGIAIILCGVLCIAISIP